MLNTLHVLRSLVWFITMLVLKNINASRDIVYYVYVCVGVKHNKGVKLAVKTVKRWDITIWSNKWE